MNRQTMFSLSRDESISRPYTVDELKQRVEQPSTDSIQSSFSESSEPERSPSKNQSMAYSVTHTLAKLPIIAPGISLPMIVADHMMSAANGSTNYTEELPDLPAKDSEPLAILMAIGGGIGANGEDMTNSNLRSRVHWQDRGILVLNIFIYFLSLALWATFTYRRATNNSPVTYFCQPSRVDGAISSHCIQDFLGTFTRAPQTTLQISGYQQAQEDSEHTIFWQGEKLRTVFSVSFDLSPWMVHDMLASNVESSQSVSVGPDDVRILEHFLTCDDNDLAFVEITKEVKWQGFDELATNIKQHIRQQGFGGITSVWLSKPANECVHKNRPWSNFLRTRTTLMLSWLSILGMLFYAVYMFLKSKKIDVHTHHKVNISTDEYWPLIVDKLSLETLPVNQVS